MKTIAVDNDLNVPVKRSLKIIQDLKQAHPELPITVRTFENSSHALFNDQTNWVRNDYLEYVDQWILQTKE